MEGKAYRYNIIGGNRTKIGDKTSSVRIAYIILSSSKSSSSSPSSSSLLSSSSSSSA